MNGRNAYCISIKIEIPRKGKKAHYLGTGRMENIREEGKVRYGNVVVN